MRICKLLKECAKFLICHSTITLMGEIYQIVFWAKKITPTNCCGQYQCSLQLGNVYTYTSTIVSQKSVVTR